MYRYIKQSQIIKIGFLYRNYIVKIYFKSKGILKNQSVTSGTFFFTAKKI